MLYIATCVEIMFILCIYFFEGRRSSNERPETPTADKTETSSLASSSIASSSEEDDKDQGSRQPKEKSLKVI